MSYIVTDADMRLGSGLVERDLVNVPYGSYAKSTANWIDTGMDLIPRAEWSARIKAMELSQSRLSDMRTAAKIASSDQGREGFCWCYSAANCLTMIRAKNNLPYVKLSPHAIGMKIFGRNRGAWGAMAMEFLSTNGCPSEPFWPLRSTDLNHDTQLCWDDAKKYTVTEGWMDIDIAAYNRDVTFDQVITSLLTRTPVVLDYMWWGHSVMGMDAVELDDSLPLSDPNRWGIRIWNSWGDQWGENGTGLVVGSKAVPDGGCVAAAVSGA